MTKTNKTWFVNENNPRFFMSVMARIVQIVRGAPGHHRLACRWHPSVSLFAPFFDEVITLPAVGLPHVYNARAKDREKEVCSSVMVDFPKQEYWMSDTASYIKDVANFHYNQAIGQGMKLDSEECYSWIWDELRDKQVGYLIHREVSANWETVGAAGHRGKSVFVAPADPLDEIVDYYNPSLWEKITPSLRNRDMKLLTWDSLWTHHPDSIPSSIYVHNSKSESIWDQLWMLASASMFIGFESWLAHVAVSMGIPSLILFPVESWKEQWQYGYPWVEYVKIDRKNYDPQGLADVVISWAAQTSEGQLALS
jgi:hypothetical protein